VKRFCLFFSNLTCFKRLLSHSGVKCVKAFRSLVRYLILRLISFSAKRSFFVINQIRSYLKIIFVLWRSWLESLLLLKVYLLRSLGSEMAGALSICFSWSIRYSLIFDSKAATEQIMAVETCDKYKLRSS